MQQRTRERRVCGACMRTWGHLCAYTQVGTKRSSQALTRPEGKSEKTRRRAGTEGRRAGRGKRTPTSEPQIRKTSRGTDPSPILRGWQDTPRSPEGCQSRAPYVNPMRGLPLQSQREGSPCHLPADHKGRLFAHNERAVRDPDRTQTG